MVDYFRWRSEDAHRNALNGHSDWMLRREGHDDHAATVKLRVVSVAGRNELLFRNGINFNDVPAWQKRGIGAYWKQEEQEGVVPRTGAANASIRRYVFVDRELPMKDRYDEFVRWIVESWRLPRANETAGGGIRKRSQLFRADAGSSPVSGGVTHGDVC